jgi:hypothetical protein
MSARKYVGRDLVPILWVIIGYRAVFEIDDGLEVDEVNMAAIERTRVYFDDVLGLTIHQARGVGFLVTTGLGALIFGLLSGSAFVDHDVVPALILAVAGLANLAVFLLRVVLKVNVVTVFGKRTMAIMKFPMSRDRAWTVYFDLSRKIAACQQKAAAAQPPPPPAPEVPLPPAPPAI